MYCPICNKNTVHETRIIDEQESYACLNCERTLKGGANAALRYENRLESDQRKLEQIVETERMRMGGPYFGG